MHRNAIRNTLVVLLVFVVLSTLCLSDDRVLPVKSVLDTTVFVDLIDDPVGVLLDSGCKDNDLEVLAELIKEFDTVGTDKEVRVRSVLHVVN